MTRLGIWEQDEGIFRAVRRRIQEAGQVFPHMDSGRFLAEFSARPMDLFVVSPWAGEQGKPVGGARCRALLIPGSAGVLLRQIGAEYAVSYGASPKDTLTISSLEGGSISVALQRELVTLAGGVLEQQELVLPFPPGGDPMPFLAGVGALLLLGLSP